MESFSNMEVSVNNIENISREEASLISWWVGKEFAGGDAPYRELSVDEWIRYQETNRGTTYILARNESGEIIGFEEIYRLDGIKFGDKTYDILGTGSLVSIERGKGVGQALVGKLIEFLNSQPKSAIGFCEDSSLEFHRKMQREVWIDGGKRVVCNGETSTSHLIVFRGEDGFIPELESHPDSSVFAPYDFW